MTSSPSTKQCWESETGIFPPLPLTIFDSSVKKDQNYGNSKGQLGFSLPNPL